MHYHMLAYGGYFCNPGINQRGCIWKHLNIMEYLCTGSSWSKCGIMGSSKFTFFSVPVLMLTPFNALSFSVEGLFQYQSGFLANISGREPDTCSHVFQHTGRITDCSSICLLILIAASIAVPHHGWLVGSNTVILVLLCTLTSS